MRLFLATVLMVCSSGILNAQTPCTLSLDSIQLDVQQSTCNNLVFKYTYSGGTPVAYKWTYGDGNACTCIKPKHFYTRNGSWQVCGRIEDANGCADSLCVSFIVNCADPCDLSGIGIYSADTLSYSCNEIEFNAITSSNTRKVLWTFGDGDSSTSKFAVHTYRRNGTYSARLIVKDSIACADTAEFNIQVNCLDSMVDCDFYRSSLDTMFSSDCRTVDFKFGFNHRSVYSKIWFGDGNSAENNLNVSHTYADTGTYRVCVVGTDSLDCTDSTCFNIRVGCSPITGIAEQKMHVNLFPNPFGTLLNLMVSEPAILHITDIHGRLVYSTRLIFGQNLLKPDITEPGFYLLHVQGHSGNRYYKVLIRE